MDNGNNKNLIRARVVTHKLAGPESAPVIAIANTSRLQLLLWLLSLVVASYLLMETGYKETLAARGVLEPRLGAQKITSPLGARVERIYVTLGEHVEKGQVLASLVKDAYNGDGFSIYSENLRQLNSDRDLLLQQLGTQQLAREQSRRWETVAAKNATANKSNLAREAALLYEQLQLSDSNLKAVGRLLEAGNSSKREYDIQYRTHLDLLGREQSLYQRQLQIDHELDAIANKQQLSELETQQTELRLRRELQAVDQRILSLGNEVSFTVVAEQTGTVAEIGLEEGMPVLAGQPLFYINPLSSELQALIFVPAAVQAKLVVGQQVLLRYDAFDYRLYGRQDATVTSIGQARIDPRETRLSIAGLNEPVFKVTAEPHSPLVQEYRLLPGSTLVADFVVAEMSLLQFIFKPLLGLRGKLT